MINPLIIDSNYCIVNNAAGQISRTFWEHVDRTILAPTILCGSLNPQLHLNSSLININERTWIRKCIGAIRKMGIPDFYYLPDTNRFAWCPQAYDTIVSIPYSFDYVHSISNPRSTHLLAKRLKEKMGIPWIAQLDDPWHDTSGRDYKFNHFSEYDLRLEGEVANNADLIIHSNEVVRDIWKERYGDAVADKMVIMPFNINIYDLPEVRPIPSNSKLELSHIGHIYNTRSAMTVFRALEILKRDNPEIANKLHFTFIGGIHEREKQYVQKSSISELVTFIPTLSPEELEFYYQRSNFFLVIDINILRSPNYPSKLMMYYYYRRPILGITNPGSQLYKELKETNNTCFFYGEVNELASMLKDAVLHYDKYLRFDNNRWKKHTVENVQNEYLNLLSTRLGFKIEEDE